MSLEDDLDSLAEKDKLHRVVDGLPTGARFAFVYETHCKEVHDQEEPCNGEAVVFVSRNCTERDVVYLSTIVERYG